MKLTLGRRAAALVILLQTTVSSPAAEGDAPRKEIESGKSALRSGRFDEARTSFGKALAESRQNGDATRQAEAFFYLGLADQQAALTGSLDADNASQLLESALRSYHEALTLAPESGGILNNLSQVQLRLGRTNDALASLARAIELPGPMRPFYVQNYAELLLRTGDWSGACRFYALVAGEQPGNREAHQKLVELCLENRPDLLGWYLWELAEAGQVIQVKEHALNAVTHPALQAEHREEMMSLVAFCLSGQNATGTNALEAQTVARLTALSKDGPVTGAASELLRVYEGKRLKPADYPWWANRIDPAAEPRRGLWPLEAFQQLLRSLADRAENAGDAATQEAYLLLSVELNRRSPDLEALIQLANVYAAQQKLERLQQLMATHEFNFLQEKGAAYRHGQISRIYRYHMALGVIYSHLGRWTSNGGIDSAEFQLNRAIETADYLAENPPADGISKVELTPKLVELLAEGYETHGKPDVAFRLRVQRAQKFMQVDDPSSAIRLMEPLRSKAPPASASDIDKAAWQRLNRVLTSASVTQPDTTIDARRVEVAPQAWTVAGGTGVQRLTPSERMAIESSLTGIVANLKLDVGGKESQRYLTLPTNAMPSAVQEVMVSGREGRVLLRHGTNLLQVPFTLGPIKGIDEKVRLVRP